MRKSYYHNTSSALLIFDLTREETFEEMEQWYLEMREIIQRDIPFLLIGNKMDLVKNGDRAISVEQAKQFAESRGSLSAPARGSPCRGHRHRKNAYGRKYCPA